MKYGWGIIDLEFWLIDKMDNAYMLMFDCQAQQRKKKKEDQETAGDHHT